MPDTGEPCKPVWKDTQAKKHKRKDHTDMEQETVTDTQTQNHGHSHTHTHTHKHRHKRRRGLKRCLRGLAILAILCVVLLAIAFTTAVLAKEVFLWPGMYTDSDMLDQQTNETIKTLVLEAVKDRCSSVFTVDQDAIYDGDSIRNIVQYGGYVYSERAVFIMVDPHFMDTLEPGENGEYSLAVTVARPEKNTYRLTVRPVDGVYRIVSFQINE